LREFHSTKNLVGWDFETLLKQRPQVPVKASDVKSLTKLGSETRYAKVDWWQEVAESR